MSRGVPDPRVLCLFLSLFPCWRCRGAGMVAARVSRRGWRAVPRSAVPGGRGGSSFLAGSGPGSGLAEAGREHGDLGFPGDGLSWWRWRAGISGGLSARVLECRCRPGTFRVCRAARAAASAAAAIASSDDEAVTWVDVMDRIDVAADGGEGFLVRGDRGAGPCGAGRGRRRPRCGARRRRWRGPAGWRSARPRLPG